MGDVDLDELERHVRETQRGLTYFEAVDVIARVREAERERDELSEVVGTALVLATMLPGEALATSHEHALVGAVDTLRRERDEMRAALAVEKQRAEGFKESCVRFTLDRAVIRRDQEAAEARVAKLEEELRTVANDLRADFDKLRAVRDAAEALRAEWDKPGPYTGEDGQRIVRLEHALRAALAAARGTR